MAKEIDNNWNGRLQRLQSIIKDRGKRDLNVQGKVIVVTTFLVSQLVYVKHLIGLPRLALRKITVQFFMAEEAQ